MLSNLLHKISEYKNEIFMVIIIILFSDLLAAVKKIQRDHESYAADISWSINHIKSEIQEIAKDVSSIEFELINKD